jgi:hypothetical protein
MKKLVLLLILISPVVAPSSGKGCKCASATGETTRWGGNEIIVVKPGGTYGFISGKVRMMIAEEPMEDALVEVFDKPDYLLCDWTPEAGNPNKCSTDPPADQRRIAACVTGKDGKFCFDNIPSGKYELRVSKATDWDVSRCVIVVRPESRFSKRGGIIVDMHLGQ